MGGRVGLKGTDGVSRLAAELGARPVSPARAVSALSEYRKLAGRREDQRVRWLTCSGRMGADVLKSLGFEELDIVYETPQETDGGDTKRAVRRFLDAGAELVLFCGGDGTARDICGVTGTNAPILGIAAGVKMYSGVFGTNPRRTAEILRAWLEGELETVTAEVVDLDEERYRQGEWVIRLHCAALTPFERAFTQATKTMVVEQGDTAVKEEIARFIWEQIDGRPDTLVLLGPGSTVQAIADFRSLDKTLLGVDAVAGGQLVGRDLDERGVLALLDRYPRRSLVLSPVGAQGFVLGRGNLQLSPEVIRRIGPENMVVAATPGKLNRTPVLRFDTGDEDLDRHLAGNGYVSVVVGDRRRRMVEACV